MSTNPAPPLRRVGQLQEILADGQAKEIEGFLMDTFTASMLVAVYNALAPKNQDPVDMVPLPALVDFGWKHTK